MSFLKIELRHQHAIGGTAQCCLERQFGNHETFADRDLTGSCMEDQELVMNADTDTLLTDKSESDNDMDSENQLRQDAEDDNEEYTTGLRQAVEVEDDTSGISESNRRRQIQCFFGQKRMFHIHDIFNWSVEVRWDEFWFQGVKHMESEALFYELMSRLPKDEESTSRNVPGESTCMGSGPSSSIVIDDAESERTSYNHFSYNPGVSCEIRQLDVVLVRQGLADKIK
ncbi:hypothetical protein EDD22DRAFT_853215 [Suillus occidentalis]|nr:hypothetical protein EDD22DRAFT_853215 [Suillus occidentalis]